MRNLSLVVIAALPLTSVPARAQQVTTQLRWEPFQIDALALDSPTGVALFRDNGVAAGIKLNQFVVRAGLGISRVAYNEKEETAVGNASNKLNTTKSVLQITPAIHAQYYVTPPTAGQVSPFVVLKVGKTFASTTDKEKGETCVGATCTKIPDTSDWTDFDKERDKQVKERANALLSPWSFVLGGGGEYFVADSLSIGMETGLRFISVSGSIDVSADDGGANRVEKDDESESYLHFLYAVVSLNLHW